MRHALLLAAALLGAGCGPRQKPFVIPPPAPEEERIAPAPRRGAVARERGLELRLRLHETTVPLGEPVVMDVELRNVAHTSARLNFPTTARFDVVAYADMELTDPVASHHQVVPPLPMQQQPWLRGGEVLARRLELPTRAEEPGAPPGLGEGRWWLVAVVSGNPALRTPAVLVQVTAP